jgi:hypothetical protein
MSALVGLLACAAGWSIGAKPWLKPRPRATIAAHSARAKLPAAPAPAVTLRSSALPRTQAAVVSNDVRPQPSAKLKSHTLQRATPKQKHHRPFAPSTYKRH